MGKTLSVRFLLKFVIALALVGVGIHFLHRYQVKKHSQSLLEYADAAEKKGEYLQMIDYLSRYLYFARGDVDVRMRMGLAAARIARTPDEKSQAFLSLEQVLRDRPDRDDIRRRAVKLAMSIGFYAQAKPHLEQLILNDTGISVVQTDPDKKDFVKFDPTSIDWEERSSTFDGELLDLYGICLATAGQYAEADGYFDAATKLQPTLVRAFGRRAGLARTKLNRQTHAEQIIQDMTVLNKFSYGAQLLAADYWKTYGVFDGEVNTAAEEAMATALELAPTNPEVLWVASKFAVNRSERLRRMRKADEAKAELEKARKYLETGIDKNPPSEKTQGASEEEEEAVALSRFWTGELYANLVWLEIRANRLAEAEKRALKGIEVLPDQQDLVLGLIEVLLRQNRIKEAEAQIQKLQQAGFATAKLDYLRARILVMGNQWLEATRLLEGILTPLIEFPTYLRQANFLLGQCYDRLGEKDRRHEAFERSIPSDFDDPLWAMSRLAVAASQAEMGRTKDAIENYNLVLETVPGAAIPLGRLLVQEQLRAKERNWTRIDEVLKDAPAGLDTEMLRTDVYIAKGKLEEAKNTLEKAKEKYPERIEPWIGLAIYANMQKGTEQAQQLLKDAEAKFGDRVAIRLARARMLSLPLTDEGKKQLAALAEGIANFNTYERRELLGGLFELARLSGMTEFAANLDERLAIENPDNLIVHFRRFDRALFGKDETTIKKVLAEIQRVDGANGSGTRTCRAVYLIWKAKQGDLSGLNEARDLLVDLEQQRQGWSRIPLSLALIYDLQGKSDEAMEKYAQAIEMGETNPEAVARLAQMYVERRRYPDVDRLLQRNKLAIERQPGLSFIAAVSSLETGDPTRALEVAEKAVTADNKDYQKQLWLGRMRILCDKRKEAEAPLRKAVELGPEEPETWMTLLQYLLEMKRQPEAVKLLDEARQRVKREEIALMVAQAYEFLGQVKEAREWYDKAILERPENVAVLRSAANFQLSQVKDEADLKRVRELLERMQKTAKSKDDQEFAARLIYLSNAVSPDPEAQRRALEALGLSDDARLDLRLPLEKLRSQALVLSLQPRRKARLDAVAILEEIDARQALRSEEKFMLAQLYGSLGEIDRAAAIIAQLLATGNFKNNAIYVSTYLRLLLYTNDQPTLVREWLATLKKLQPDAPRTAELQFRAEMAEGKKQEAVKNLLAAIDGKNELLLQAALLLENHKDSAAAEALIKRFIANSKKDTSRLLLAEFYARQNRASEALDVVERDAKLLSPEIVVAVVQGILYTVDSPRKEDIQRARKLIEKNPSKNSDPRMVEAAFRNLEGDYAGAVSTYRNVLQADPGNVLVMNNLAYLIAYHEKEYTEALEMLKKAKSAGRPPVELLDTEASILIATKKLDQAIQLLEDTVVVAPKAGNYYHLAWAYDEADRKNDAKAALDRAKKLGLRPSDVHALERATYESLMRKYK